MELNHSYNENWDDDWRTAQDKLDLKGFVPCQFATFTKDDFMQKCYKNVMPM